MARCKSWRARPSEETDYLPVGGSRKLWKRCRNRLQPGEPRCETCENALVQCPDVRVRRALAAEDGMSDVLARELATDGDQQVRDRALEVLNGQKGIWD